MVESESKSNFALESEVKYCLGANFEPINAYLQIGYYITIYALFFDPYCLLFLRVIKRSRPGVRV